MLSKITPTGRRSWTPLLAIASMLALVGVAVVSGPVRAANNQPPNILLIVMDDIGIDQWQLFGYGGATPAAMPNIETIAKGGVKFHNLWSMPACSNGRATLFTGRYPFRTHVYTALGDRPRELHGQPERGNCPQIAQATRLQKRV